MPRAGWVDVPLFFGGDDPEMDELLMVQLREKAGRAAAGIGGVLTDDPPMRIDSAFDASCVFRYRVVERV